MPAHGLRSLAFRRERESAWRRLEGIVARVERSGLGSLSAEELTHLPVLYRSTLSSLAVARSISLDRNLLEYLEALCERAYVCVYGTKGGMGRTVGDFLARRFPATVRRFRWHVVVAGLFLVLTSAAGYRLVRDDPERYYDFVGEAMAQGRDPTSSREELRAVLYGTGEGEVGQLGRFASFLFSHNARIGMLCFALGFAAGVPVAILLLVNGLGLGAFIALYDMHGLGGEFLAWILPHGVTEILAIVLCAGMGLVLAESVVFPGVHTRLENLARKGREAGVVVVGAVGMFFVAGLIEGLFRQLVHDVPTRWAVASLSAVAWALYLGLAGRGREAT